MMRVWLVRARNHAEKVTMACRVDQQQQTMAHVAATRICSSRQLKQVATTAGIDVDVD